MFRPLFYRFVRNAAGLLVPRAITAADLQWFFSQQGGEAYTGSLGGAIGTTQLTSASDQNLFDHVSGDDADAGDTEYRCFYVKNNHGTLDLSSTVIYISLETPGADSCDIGKDPAGISGTATTIANEDTAPAGVSFSHPTSKATGISLGTLTPGDYHAIWVKRVVPSSCAAYTTNQLGLTLAGDTPA